MAAGHRLPQPPIARAAMLIRAPAPAVFEALVDPATTSTFWFSGGSGRLEPGATVRWEWAMHGVSTDVVVEQLEPGRLIRFTWDGYGGRETVEFTLEPRSAEATFVSVTNALVGDAQVAQAIAATEGFALVLAGMKALLEHGIALNLVGDRHPNGVDGG